MGTIRYDGGSTVDTTLVTTAETVVATVSGVHTPRRVNVQITGWAQLATGTGTTTVTPRIRRGTTVAGVQLGDARPVALGAAAGSTEEFEFQAEDAGVDLAGASYVLTLEQTGATGNGTVAQARIAAELPD